MIGRQERGAKTPLPGKITQAIGVGVATNSIPLWSLCNSTLTTPETLFYLLNFKAPD